MEKYLYDDQVVELIRQGKTYKEIGLKFLVSRQRICQIAKRNQLHSVSREKRYEEKSIKIKKLYDEGFSQGDICKKLNVSRKIIRKIVAPRQYVCRFCGEKLKAKGNFCSKGACKNAATSIRHAKDMVKMYPQIEPLLGTQRKCGVCCICGAKATFGRSTWCKDHIPEPKYAQRISQTLYAALKYPDLIGLIKEA